MLPRICAEGRHWRAPWIDRDENRLNKEEDERLESFNLEKIKRGNQIKNEKRLLEKIDQTYKEELDKADQEKLLQIEEINV